MSNDVASSVTKWLKDESGYPLEMRTAAALGSAGFEVVQGDYFPDDKTGVLRELDVTGYVSRAEGELHISVALLVECKASLKNQPWLLFTSTSTSYPANLAVVRRSTTDRGHKLLHHLQFEPSVQNSVLFKIPGGGYALSTAMRDPKAKDPAYVALTGLCSATLGHLERLNGVGYPKIIAFDWPVIVISAPLLECSLDAAEEVLVREIDKGTLIWRNPILNRHTIVNVYTESAFRAELRALHKAATEFADLALMKAIELEQNKKL